MSLNTLPHIQLNNPINTTHYSPDGSSTSSHKNQSTKHLSLTPLFTHSKTLFLQMAMSLNTLPHIPLNNQINTTHYSPDGSSISSDSSKPTVSAHTYSTTSDVSNIPQTLMNSQQTDICQKNNHIKNANPLQQQKYNNNINN
eukprot:159715_1